MIMPWRAVFKRSINLIYLLFFGCIASIVTFRLFQSHYEHKQYFQFPGIYGKPLHVWAVLSGAAILTVLLLLLAGFCRKLADKTHIRFAFVFFPLFMLLQLVFAYLFRVQPRVWDFEVIYRAAIGFTEGVNAFRSYFEDYTNNIGITMMLTGVYWLAKAFDFRRYYLTGVLFNIVMIDLGVLLLYMTSRKMFGIRLASMTLIFSLLFTPFITYVPIFYTDTIPLPLGIGMIYFYLLSRDHNGSHKILFITLAALLGVAGVTVKATFAILFVAVLVHLAFTESFFRVFWQAVLLISVLAGGTHLYAASVDRLQILSMPYKEAGYPFTHWIMMGMKGPFGFYDAYEVNFTESFQTKERRKEANLKVIRARLDRYGLRGTAKLLAAKSLFTWGDGTYFAPVKLNREVPAYKWYHKYILPLDVNKNTIYIYVCQMYQMSLLMLLLASGFRQLASRTFTAVTVCSLAILGLGLFLLLWEARSRYLIHFAPLILLCSLDGLAAVRPPVAELSFKPFWKKTNPT